MEDEKEKNVSESPENENEELDEKNEEEKETEETDEDEELFADEEDFDEEEGNSWERVRDFVQDNLRVILSVLIVALIAVGIYNYSQKPTDQSDQSLSQIDQMVGDKDINIANDNGQPSTEVTVKDQSANDNVVVKDQKDNSNKNVNAKVAANTNEEAKTETAAKPATETVQAEVKAENTGAGIKVQAVKGDGMTHLARKALKEHIASGQDSDLSKEQKIYIEDYLRKNVGSQRVMIGETQEFSNSLISEAISKAKQLNERQLNNLKRFSARVSDL